MSRKSLLITFLLFGLFYPMLAQKNEIIQFYLSPHIGVEWTLSTFENRKERPPYLIGIKPRLSDKYGISLVADFKRKFSLELGYGFGNVGWGLNYKSQTDSALNAISGGILNTTDVKRLSIKLVKPVKLVKIKRRKEKDFTGDPLKIPDPFKYWVIFDINILAGFSYEYIPPFVSGELGLSVGSGTDVIQLDDTWERANPYGGGVFTGFSLQLYQWNRRRLEIGFIYHKGLSKRIIVKWETSINGVDYPTFKTFTRGSMLAMYVAYPIPLFKIKSL